MPLISVLTPSIRKTSLDIVARSLKKQTLEEWEWIICSPFDPEIKEAIWIKDSFEGGMWSLNRAYNALFEKAQAKLCVSLQDSIYLPPNTLEALLDDYMTLQANSCIAVYGDQYDKLDDFGKPVNKVWNDPRKSYKSNDSFYEITWPDLEWNCCTIPRQAIFDIGGFDEEYDFLARGVDAYAVNERLNAIGYRFYVDKTLENFTLRHDRSDYGGQEAWDKSHGLFNGKYQERKKELIKVGKWPILSYLTPEKKSVTQ